MKKILVTGCAGFIGYHLCKKIQKNKFFKLFGIDNINSYYDVKLKKDRLKDLKRKNKNFIFYNLDLKNRKRIEENFIKNNYDYIIHLAAQAGVRYSITNPHQYISNNIVAFHNILFASKEINVKHFIYASTSSVYGDVSKFPLKETENTDKPLSIYAASKKSNEVLAHSYSNIFKIPTTGLRFFTVYGPFGRPDMFLFKFISSIFNNKKIDIFNKGNHFRDFTYIDDITNYAYKIIDKPSKKNIPFQIFNLGNGKSISLKLFIKAIENKLKFKARKNYLALQQGDVHKTHASVKSINSYINYSGSKTNYINGINKFIDWYKKYYNANKYKKNK